MPKQTIRDLDIANKTVLVRVDFNVPLNADGSIADDSRIQAALPTLVYLLKHDAAVIVISHLGRPTQNLEHDRNLRMDVVAARLQSLLPDVPMKKCDEVTGAKATAMAEHLGPGSLLMLENLRFDSGEKQGDETFAAQLHALADVYVNDAFASCHRTDASMYALALAFPKEKRVIGFLVENEIDTLAKLLASPEKPAVAIMGGAKISDKLGVISRLVSSFNHILIGGALAYTCLKAKGIAVGASLVDDDEIEDLLTVEKGAFDIIVLPQDHVVVKQSDPTGECKIVDNAIPDGWIGMDIGPKTIAAYKKILDDAETIIWNGPLGKFEDRRFQMGTLEIAKYLAASRAVTIIGGGDSSAAVAKFGLTSKMTHVTTGGGAFLEFLEKGTLPALTVIEDI